MKAAFRSALLVLAALCPLLVLADAAPQKITISVPGPRNISYLPIDLIPKIGADKAEGIEVQLLHTGGGGVALSNLMNHNTDFAVAGMPAAMSLRANGGKVVVIGSVDDAPLFVFMVRADLKNKVKRIADLKGMVIGVNTSSLSSKTTSQQLAELVLKSDGIATDMVRVVAAGQSWMEQSSLMASKTADAIMGDEPFASRLLAENKVFFLANLADPKTSEKIPGANFLHAALETREDVIAGDPQRVEKVAAILRRTLQWIAAHTPEQVVAALGFEDKEERDSMLASLKKYPHLYSKDGRLSTRQLHETERFFHGTSEGNPAAQELKVESMVVDKWAGKKD
ncbi:MAG: ABC transporter substrate-binding protein [Sulfuricella sp.]|nr:ABC transporter substrate-binding protein [Sulfuricella sp.]